MTSTHHSSCPSHRWSIGVGAVLVGAVIPIAAAASAWADGLTETEDFGQLVGQGLNYYEAYEVVQAESSGLPVEVSYDGQVVVEDNEPTNPLLGAFAESGSGHDVAAAIATNSPAIENQTIADSTLGSNDTAFADGGGSFALAGDEVPTSISNNDTATAIGTYSFAYATAGSNDNATDIGSNSFAVATGNADTVYDVGSGVGNGANDVTAGGDNDFLIGFGNGLPNTDVVNNGVFDIVTPQSGDNILSGAASTDAAASADGAAFTSNTPADLLSDASTNYTDAGQLLSDIPSSSVGEYAPALASQVEFDGNMVHGIANLDSAETALSSYGNGILAEFLNPVFTNIDQSWDSASQAALDTTQALDGVVGSGSTVDIAAGFLAVSTSEFEALQPAIQAEFIDLGAHFLTGGDFTSFADLGAGLDPVTAVDPTMFADLVSSIGL